MNFKIVLIDVSNQKPVGYFNEIPKTDDESKFSEIRTPFRRRHSKGIRLYHRTVRLQSPQYCERSRRVIANLPNINIKGTVQNWRNSQSKHVDDQQVNNTPVPKHVPYGERFKAEICMDKEQTEYRSPISEQNSRRPSPRALSLLPDEIVKCSRNRVRDELGSSPVGVV